MSQLNVVRLSEVKGQPLSWIWPGRIPRGKVTLLAGDPGLGKSFVTTDIAARITRADSQAGDWPDGPSSLRQPGDVIFLNAEDDPADTIRPRLERAGANLRHVHFVSGIRRVGRTGQSHVALDEDIGAIARAIRECERPRLVVIDPISAYMGQADSNSNSDVRSVLAELTAVAQATGVGVLCVTHLSKGSGNTGGPAKAVYRAMGSLAFTAAARMVWYVQAMPDDPTVRVMSLVKCNICPPSKGMSFRIEDGRIRWLDTAVELTADELENADTARERIGIPEAVDFLRSVLADGPIGAVEITRLSQAALISEWTLKHAKREAGVISRNVGGSWAWALPGPTQSPAPS